MKELYNNEDFDQRALLEEEAADEEFRAPQNIDAYYAQVSITESVTLKFPWFLDSRAFHHVIGEREVFSSLRSSSGICKTIACGQSHNVIGIGNVAIKLKFKKLSMFSTLLVLLKIYYQLSF